MPRLVPVMTMRMNPVFPQDGGASDGVVVDTRNDLPVAHSDRAADAQRAGVLTRAGQKRTATEQGGGLCLVDVAVPGTGHACFRSRADFGVAAGARTRL